MKRKIKKTIFILLLFTIFILYLIEKSKIKYGNNIESIKEIIISKTSSDLDFTIFEIKDIGLYRVAGFVCEEMNSYNGIAVFQRDFNKNYHLKDFKISHTDRDIVTFTTIIDNEVYTVVLSNNKKLEKIKIENGSFTDNIHVNGNPSLSFWKEPHGITSSEFSYYSKDGKIIQ